MSLTLQEWDRSLAVLEFLAQQGAFSATVHTASASPVCVMNLTRETPLFVG